MSWRLAVFVLLGVAAAWGAQAGTPVAALLQRLTFSAGPNLDQVHLRATESWTESTKTEDSYENDAVFFHHGVPIEVETSSDGHPLGSRARQRQQRSAQRQEQAIDALGPASALNLSGEIWTLPHFESMFRWSDAGSAGCGGPSCLTLAFVPAAGLHPATRLERILARSAGTITVDASTGQVLRGAFHSLGPVNFGAGVLARITQFSGSFEMQPVPGSSAWVMRKVVVNVQGRKLLHRFHGTERMLYAVETSGVPPASR